MSDRPGAMSVFVRIVDSGSMSAAARALGMTPSAVSKLVTRLETRLGVRLLHRTPRQLRLSHEGELYYRRAVEILADIEDMETALVSSRSKPQGRIRVNSSLSFARHQIVPRIPAFLERYPEICIDLWLTDHMVDIMREQVDVAIRIGALADSSMTVRPLAASRMIVVAAPRYLERCGIPDRPESLEHHNCLRFNFIKSLNVWPFRAGHRAFAMVARGNADADSGETLRQLALDGLGIARLSEFMVGADIGAGHLVPVLESYSPGDEQQIHALYWGRKPASRRVKCFVDFLIEAFSPPPWRSDVSAKPGDRAKRTK